MAKGEIDRVLTEAIAETTAAQKRGGVPLAEKKARQGEGSEGSPKKKPSV